MAQFEVTAPTGYSGAVASVRFDGGRATADSERDRAALAYFRRHSGYTVAPVPSDNDQAAADDGQDDGDGGQDDGDGEQDGPAAPKKNASRAAWAEHAVALGIPPAQVAEATTRVDVMLLIDKWRTPEADPEDLGDDEDSDETQEDDQ